MADIGFSHDFDDTGTTDAHVAIFYFLPRPCNLHGVGFIFYFIHLLSTP